MNILITGGLGHVGSYFLEFFKKIKNLENIIVIDNNSNNRINNVFNKKNKFKFILADLTNEKVLKDLNSKIDIILHLASITNAEASVKNKKEVEFNNYKCFKNIVKFAIKKNSKLIHISSTSVYGSQKKLVGEDCEELMPQSPYAKVKLNEEKYLIKTKKLKFITLRFGTIVGFSKGMRFHTAVNKFCLNAIFDLPITVWKTAIDQYRPYLSIKDAFLVLKYIIEKNYFDRKIHNVLSNNYTVRQLIKKIEKLKRNIKIKFVSSEIMNQLSYKVINKTNLLSKIKLRKKIDNDIKDIFLSFKKVR